MEFETRQRQTPVVNLSALIDIAFILVIFIVLAANFDRLKNLEVTLPQAEADADVEPESLRVVVPTEGPVRLEDKQVAWNDVRQALAQRAERFTSVLLVADEQASMQRAVKILGDARAAGFDAVGIATRRPKGGRR